MLLRHVIMRDLISNRSVFFATGYVSTRRQRGLKESFWRLDINRSMKTEDSYKRLAIRDR
jgi:hypothetical protein